MSDRRLDAARGRPRAYFLFLVALFMIAWLCLAVFRSYRDRQTAPGHYTAEFDMTGNLQLPAKIHLFLNPDGRAEITCPGPRNESRSARGSWSKEGSSLRVHITSNEIRNATSYRDEDVCFWEGTHYFKFSDGELTSMGIEEVNGRLEPYQRRLRGITDEVRLVYSRD